MLAGIVENAPTPIFLKDTHGTYLYINVAYAESGGIPRENIIGKTDLDVYPESIAIAFRSIDALAMKSAEPVRSTLPLAVGDEVHIFQTVRFPIRSAGGDVLGVCGIALDVTSSLHDEELKREEEELIISSKPFGRLLATLTPQEVRVAELLLLGFSDKQIAEVLHLTSDTVRHHVSHVLKKLRKPSRTQAVIAMLQYRKKP